MRFTLTYIPVDKARKFRYDIVLQDPDQQLWKELVDIFERMMTNGLLVRDSIVLKPPTSMTTITTFAALDQNTVNIVQQHLPEWAQKKIADIRYIHYPPKIRKAKSRPFPLVAHLTPELSLPE